jgi:biopolymer transport protein TolQ
MFHIFQRGSTLGMIFGYDIFTGIIMIGLLLVSVFSWTVIIYKRRSLNNIARANRKFMEKFKQRKTFDDAFASSHPASPLFLILAEGLAEAQRLSGGQKLSFPLEVLPNIQAAMDRAIGDQVEAISRRLITLATIANVAPLIGLLGTVWGIMVAFVDIKHFGSTSIQVVAPGIAEALVTTIAGLVVAIPASVAFNAYNSRIRHMAGQMENLSSEFLGDLRVHSVFGGK